MRVRTFSHSVQTRAIALHEPCGTTTQRILREKWQKRVIVNAALCCSGGNLSSPMVIRVPRPYANEEEYLASERFSIDSKSMLLIDQPPLALDTLVVFEIQLQNGQRPIRAEARVVGNVAPTSNSPGGLRVRFTRFGVATKAFIERASGVISASPAVARESTSSAPASRRAASISSSVIDTGWSSRPASISLVPSHAAGEPEPARPTPELAAKSLKAAERSELNGVHPQPAKRATSISSSSLDAGWSTRPAAMLLVPPPAADQPGTTRPAPEPAAEPRQMSERRESSGVRRRPVVPVVAPANREELLERLRCRARPLAAQSERTPPDGDVSPAEPIQTTHA